MHALHAQTEIAASALTSAAGQSFIAQLPTVEDLMPRLIYSEVSSEAEPPIIEQLISPNALRQRRFRERQAALRNASEALHTVSRNAESDREQGPGDDANEESADVRA